MLYRVLFDEPWSTAETARKAFKTLKNIPALRMYVRRIYFREGYSEYDDGFVDEAMETIRLLPHCTILARTGNTSYFKRSIIQFTALKHLFLASIGRAGINGLDVAVDRLSHVEDLRLQGNCNAEVSWPTSEDFLPSLRNLKLAYVQRDWYNALPTTRNTLHTLVLYYCNLGNPELFVDFLEYHAQSLRRISLVAVDWLVDPVFSLDNRLATLVPNAEEIFIRGMFIISDAIFASIPTLRAVTVSLAFYLPVKAEACLEMLKVCKSSGAPLRSLALQVRLWDADTDVEISRLQHEWTQVQASAAEHEIDFSCACFRNSENHPHWILGADDYELVPTWSIITLA
jgi:hypothetical protein